MRVFVSKLLKLAIQFTKTRFNYYFNYLKSVTPSQSEK
jgi:hypothetical protein